MYRAARIEEIVVKIFIYISVLLTIGILFSIIFHILKEGLGVLSWKFITAYPEDMGRYGGIYPSIIGTLYLLLVALAFAVPVGIMSAISLAEYSRKGKLAGSVRFVTEILAGTPTIIFGLFGFAFLVVFLNLRWSILSGGLTLGVMILPTIIKASEVAIKNVPRLHRESSLSLGASRWQTVFRIVLPAAAPGILSGILIGTGRAVGETAALLLTAGSSLNLPVSIMDPARSLSMHLYFLASEGTSSQNAYGTASLLILLILIINITANILLNKITSSTK